LYLIFGLLPAKAWLALAMFAAYGLFLPRPRASRRRLSPTWCRRKAPGRHSAGANLIVGVLLLPASVIFGWLWATLSPLSAFAFGSTCALAAALLLRFWVMPVAFAPDTAQPR
jgi:hypothetical protein